MDERGAKGLKCRYGGKKRGAGRNREVSVRELCKPGSGDKKEWDITRPGDGTGPINTQRGGSYSYGKKKEKELGETKTGTGTSDETGGNEEQHSDQGHLKGRNRKRRTPPENLQQKEKGWSR